MSERSAEQIRLEIVSERQGLAADLDVLQGEARRLAGVALACLLTAFVLGAGVKLLSKRR